MKKSILFICTHNTNRSQMTEGLMRHFYGKYFDVYSAGTTPKQPHPFAIEALRRINIDISQQRSQHIDDFLSQSIDFVITVCDTAKETCPLLPANTSNIHHAFSDPSNSPGNKSDVLDSYCLVRDNIKQWLDQFAGPYL